MLLNQFGIPGPAEPPVSEEAAPKPAEPKAAAAGLAKEVPSFAKDLPSSSKAESGLARETPAHPKPPTSFERPTKPGAADAPRRRSSMWGDEIEENVPAAPMPTASKAAPPPMADPLREMAELRKTEPTVPGFDVPPSTSPEPPKAPVKRSAWDTLIGSLGIKSASSPEPEPVPPAAAPPAWKSRPAAASETLPSETPAREKTAYSGRVESSRSERPAAEDRPSREPIPAKAGGFGAGLIDSDERPESDARSRHRRGGPADIRDPTADRRGFDAPRGNRPEPSREPVGGFEDRDFVPPVRSRLDDIRADAEPSFREAADDQEMPRRRSRRRGQRQRIAGEELGSVVEGGEIAGSVREPDRESLERRSPARVVDEERGPRREQAAGRERRERPPREASGRERERESSGRSRPVEGVDRGPARSSRRPPRQEQPRGEAVHEISGEALEDDLLVGFGEGLLDDVAEAVTPGDEERASRPRRRRGRRGRGRGGRSEEAATASPEAPIADAYLAPGFDDDLEDDDEAERIRHRSRGSRADAGRSAGVRTDTARPEASAEPRRPSRPAADRPDRDIPTWIDTVSLLVNANINRRSSGGGGGGSRGQGGGRERRR